MVLGGAVAASLILVGCGGSGGAGGHTAARAGVVSRSTSGLPLPLPASGRFDMGIATTAMPVGWALIDTPDTQYDRQQSIEHGGGLDGFAILPRGADPNNSADDFPLLSIGGGTGGTGGPPGPTLAEQKQTAATSMAALKPDGFSNFRFLADTTVGGVPAYMDQVTDTATGPKGTVADTVTEIGVIYRGQLYGLSLATRGLSVPRADLAALETLRASWRWS